MSILISFISLGIAFFALGWNVYKDVIQKPRLKASFGVYTMVTMPKINIDKSFIYFSGVNIGPGDMIIKNIILKYKRNEKPYAIVIPDNQWTKLPQKIAVGEEAEIVTPYFTECFLSTDFWKAGLIDSYGRYHWVSKKNIIDARKSYAKDFRVISSKGV